MIWCCFHFPLLWSVLFSFSLACLEFFVFVLQLHATPLFAPVCHCLRVLTSVLPCGCLFCLIKWVFDLWHFVVAWVASIFCPPTAAPNQGWRSLYWCTKWFKRNRPAVIFYWVLCSNSTWTHIKNSTPWSKHSEGKKPPVWRIEWVTAAWKYRASSWCFNKSLPARNN